MEKRLPWGRIVALARRPDTIGLGGEGGVRGIENGINPKGNLSAAEESLRSDPARAGRADELAAHARQVCGDGAPDAQVANVMLCLGKNALVPVREVAALVGASINFDDPAAISVTLTKQNDGTVRVEIQSQEALREEKGHFRLVLDVKPDGEMTAREFEVSPNAATLNDRNIEERSRLNELTAAPMLATGNEPGGLGEVVRGRAATFSPDVKLDAGVLDVFASQIRGAMSALTIIPPLCSEEEYAEQLAILPAPARDLAQAVRNRGGLPTRDELRQVRDNVVNAFFSRLEAAAQEVPDNQRAQFTRTCLEHMFVPPASACAATAQLASTFTHVLGRIAAAHDANEALQLMEGLNTVIDTINQSALKIANEKRLARGQLPLGKDEAIALQSTALRMALHTLADQMGGGELGMSCLAEALCQKCGPFSDMLYDLAHASAEDERASPLKGLCELLRVEIANKVSPEMAAHFDPGEIRERNLSLARQREILGKEKFITRGAHTDINLNETLSRGMTAVCEYVCADAQKEIRKYLPTDSMNPEDPDWSMRDVFLIDIRRNGIIVNDRFLPPGKEVAENETAFIAQFPDRRTAVVLSTIANQVLPSIFINALGRVPGRQGMSQEPGAAQATKEGDVLTNAMRMDKALFGGESPQSVRIDSLGGNRYRVSYAQAKIAGNNGHVSPNDTERFLTEVSIDVVVGNPPTVENARGDLLLRGREAVPGEPALPAVPQPSGPVLRPPARRPT
jgi:hypothetical protein